MMKPTVHLNGTSKTDLYVGYETARDALYVAMRAFMDSYPNGRDYYPQGPDAIHQAVQEHTERLAKLEEVYEDLKSLMEAVS